MSVRLRLKQVVLSVLDDPDVEFSDALSPENCAAWDSVAMVQLMLAIESEFGVQFSTSEMSEVHSARDLVTLLAKHGQSDS